MGKIVHLTTVHPRFDTRVFVNQGKSLAAKYGDDFHLIVADGKGNATVDGVQIIDLGKSGRGRIMRVLVGSWRAFAEIRRLKPKLVHFHDPELMFLGMILSLFGYRVIYDVHEDIEETIKIRQWIPAPMRLVISKLIRLVERVAALFYSAIVTVTPKIAGKYPAGKTSLVQNYPRISELETDEIIPYPQRENKIVYVGGLTRRRAVFEMVSALALVSESYNLTLTLIGTFGPPELEQELNDKPGWEKIDFVGWGDRTKIARHLGEARAGIVLCLPDPNHMNAKPVKLYEYMSTELPVIAADFPVWRDQIKGVDCSIFVDPLDPQAIADAMMWILDNPERAMQMGENGKNAVVERFNWDIEATRLYQIYHDLLCDNTQASNRN